MTHAARFCASQEKVSVRGDRAGREAARTRLESRVVLDAHVEMNGRRDEAGVQLVHGAEPQVNRRVEGEGGRVINRVGQEMKG
jgi:hypothetical protein